MREFSWVKAHTGIYVNELADRLTKAAARSRDRTVAFNRIAKSTFYSEIEDEGNQKWQKRMGKLQEGNHHKTVFPSSTRQAKIKNKHKPSFRSYGDRTRENMGLPPPI
jgi:hypothetical protein